jgi:hypothetical protein
MRFDQLTEEKEMTETVEKTGAEILAEDGPAVTVADLIAKLQTFPQDAPVVLSTDGPDPAVCCPLEWQDVMGYYPTSPYHGDVADWDPAEDDTDEPDPTVVKAVVLGHRGVPDEYR